MNEGIQRVVLVDQQLDPNEFIIGDEVDISSAPTWSIQEMVKTFFPNRSPYWVRLQERQLGITAPRSETSTARSFDLRYIERFIHLLAEHGKLTLQDLIGALVVLRQIAIITGVIKVPLSITPLRSEP